jgi:hypothetical protein
MSRNHTMPPGYDEKFAGFIRACAKAKAEHADYIFIAAPWVIGDTYEEAMESLARLAEAGVALKVVGDEHDSGEVDRVIAER